MKILFISYRFYPYIGGIEVNSEILATCFEKKGHEVVLLTNTPISAAPEKEWPFKVVRKPSFFEKVKLFFWADVVFENNPSLSISWLVKIIPSLHIVAIRTWVRRMDDTISWQDKLKFWWLKSANATIAISESVRKQACASAVVIGNPYRAELFYINDKIARDKTFVLMGRLVTDKGFDLAIRAFKDLIQKNNLNDQMVHMTIIGDGPERSNLQNLVKELNIENSVTFKGALLGEMLANCLNEHQFLIVPSRWEEPFGNVALEGMACGCVPIVSDGGGLPDAVGDAGILFERGNYSHLADIMEQLLIIKTVDILQLKLNAKEHLKQHLPEIVGGRYLNVIHNAWEKKRKF